jgi:polyisoprenoid-binding protein YceI
MNTATKLLLPLSLAAVLAACAQQTPAPADTTAAAATTEAAPAAPQAEAIAVASGTYKLDPTHTDVLAQWNHMSFSNPTAHFGTVDGTLVYNAEDVSQSSVEVTLPLSGLNSFTAAFDEHLRSADFFDVATFPVATFKNTKVEAAGTNKLTVTGDLTIKDQTKPVVLDVTVNGAGEHPMRKVPAVGFEATASVKRSDFGLGMAAPAVSDEVALRITTEATQAPAETAAE